MVEWSLSRTEILVLSGTANEPLSQEIAAFLDRPLCDVTIRRFADGEIFVRINENARGRDAYIIQPTNPPAENLLELLILVDAAKRASAARVTVVVPYFGYARQDRKDQPRVAISAKLVANLIETAGADRVLGIDFHQHQLQGFFDVPVDHLYASPVFVQHYRQKALKDLVVVAPDVGSAKMARSFAKRLDASLAIIDKRRPSANVGRHDGHRGHHGRGGNGPEAARRARRVLLRDARAAVGPGGGPPDGGPGQGGRGHEHDPPPGGEAVRPAGGPVGGAAAGQGDQAHALGPVGKFVVRLTAGRFGGLTG